MMNNDINENPALSKMAVKCRFFAQYFGQQVYKNPKINNGGYICFSGRYLKNGYLELKPISEITNEDAIQVAKIAHQIYSDNWEVKKIVDSSVHIELKGRVNDVYHVSIGFRECSINANHHFLKTEDDSAKSFKVNIGQVNMSSSKPIGYVYAIDYLRSKGYAVPFMEYSVSDLISFGWLQLL